MRGVEKSRGIIFKSMTGVLAAVVMACGMSDAALASGIQTDMPSQRQIEGMAYPQELNAEALRRLFDHYESIPDIVLEQGDEALQAWEEAHLQEGRAGFWGCAAAVAGVIATTAFPAAKILKIKKLIKALGGVRSAIKIMAGASFNYEKLKALGGAVAALAAELTGIGSVKSQCFA